MDISRKWNRLAFRLSAVVFVVLLTAFSIWVIRFDNKSRGGVEPSRPDGTSSAEQSPQQKKEAEAAKAHTHEEFAELLPQPGETNADTVNRGLETTYKQAQARTHEENLSELDRKGEQLNQYSSEESLEKISEKMAAWTGTTTRATAPLENPPPGNVDLDTAQIHDVIRKGTAEDGYRYVSIIFDSVGRSMEVEMSPEDGKKAWETMQMIKKNPMMETVYRRMVIPLLDKTMGK